MKCMTQLKHVALQRALVTRSFVQGLTSGRAMSSVPRRMKAAVHDTKTAAVSTQEVETPDISESEVLVEVKAAGVNRPDLLQRKGLYPPPPGSSPLLGLEIAGTVARIGKNTKGLKEGDEVMALTNGGGYAGYVAVEGTQVLPKPHNMSFLEAACVPETLFTVCNNVMMRGQLKPGEKFLVHGGSGGIGTMAIQVAAAVGAEVYCTAGSAMKAERCEELGATKCFNYKQQDFASELKEHKLQMDVILDMIGGEYIEKNLRSLARDGRLVQIAFMTGSKAEVDFMRLMLKRLTITGSTLRSASASDKAAIADLIREVYFPMMESGTIYPVIHQSFPLEEVDAAHTVLDSGDCFGKIGLLVG